MEMKIEYDSRYPSLEYIIRKAKRRTPGFAWDYLNGGCNEEINLNRNRTELQAVQLMPQYLNEHLGSDLKTELFGYVYDAPFGIAPVGLQGLMCPGAPEFLARAAFDHNVPFILSTVTTSSIETIGKITEGKAWFQLYHPAKDELRDDLLQRAADVGCPVLVALSDVPTFGYRPKEIRNGLAMPPKMTMRNILQIIGKPGWGIRTLIHGQPNFETMRKYMPKKMMSIKQLGKYMNETFSGRLNEDKLGAIRDKWKGKLVLKGVVSEEDTEKCIKLGVDGIIVSNHGGRQLDAGESTVKPLARLSKKYGDKLVVMMDSGIRTGPDVARAMASGAAFTFMGRTFMYGVCALGKKGGYHTISMLKVQLQQVMDQICCAKVNDFPKHLIV